MKPMKIMKIMMKNAWGSDDPTKPAFPFSHGLALAGAGHEVQIYLLGEAVVLMRKAVASSVTPVGWPPGRRLSGQTRCKESHDLRLPRMCSRSRCDRGRPCELERQVRQSGDSCIAGRVGGPGDHRVRCACKNHRRLSKKENQTLVLTRITHRNLADRSFVALNTSGPEGMPYEAHVAVAPGRRSRPVLRSHPLSRTSAHPTSRSSHRIRQPEQRIFRS